MGNTLHQFRVSSVIAQRLVAQQIGRHDFSEPRDLVGWLGAVQAQDYYGAKWALGLRLRSSSDAAIERALDEGTILRTHAMRGTWQFIAREDVRWMLGLFSAHVIARTAGRHRDLGLDAKTFRRSHAVLERAMRGKKELARSEIAVALERAGISTEGPRLSHILAVAELEAVITSGSKRRYALLDDRAPASRSVDPDDALVELAGRYLQSRAPATASDFQWWTGLPMARVRAAIEAVRVETGRAMPNAGAHLLPAFDEWLIGYRDRSAVIAPKIEKRLPERGGMLNPVVIVDGRVIGTWSRTLGRKVVIEHRLHARTNANAIADATRRYLQFLG